MSSRKLTSDDLERFKREAKKLRRSESSTHMAALDAIARREGFPDWWHLQHSVAHTTGLALAGRATTARACLEGFLGYLTAGDAPSACSFLVEPDRTLMVRVSRSRTAILAAIDALTGAVDERFGAGSADWIRHGASGQLEPLVAGLRERGAAGLEKRLDESLALERAVERFRERITRSTRSPEKIEAAVERFRASFPEKLEKIREDSRKLFHDVLDEAQEQLRPVAAFIQSTVAVGDPLQAIANGTEIVDVVERGDRATARILKTRFPGAPPVEDTIELEKDRGFWFSHGPRGGRGKPTPEDERFVGSLASGLESAAAALDGLAREIESDAVPTRAAADERVKAIFEGVMGALAL
jgi:hypothetical protein